jgi:hypothetical protein
MHITTFHPEDGGSPSLKTLGTYQNACCQNAEVQQLNSTQHIRALRSGVHLSNGGNLISRGV